MSIKGMNLKPYSEKHNDEDGWTLLSGSFFVGARDFTVHGGEFYNVGGNLTIQRTGK
jgi:hypothetical protein